MSLKLILSRSFGLLFLFLAGCTTKPQGPNLVPLKGATSPNYWCTWYAQNYWIQRGGEIKDLKMINNPNAREQINYHHLFDAEEGWATTYLKHSRKDFYFLIDHGWQTKRKEERVKGASPFFSLQLDTHDFPEYSNARPEEQLRLFNEEIQAQGWRGLGLWVRGEVNPENAEKFVKWSKYAGIEYWKIDGGDIVTFNAHQAKQKYYPELTLEYVTPCGNLNPNWDKPDLGSYPSLYICDSVHQAKTLHVLRNADVFRTYDASPQLMSTTTLRRVHDLLKQTSGHPEYISKLNVQDDCNAAAALGCLVASKRHPNFNERTLEGKDLHHQLNGKRHMQGRINEVERFGHWERLAPAFPCGEGSYVYSQKELVDCFPYDKYSTWNKATYHKMVYQSAPAIMARNMELPKVEPTTSEFPFVMATTYPNGPVCIATEGRVKPTDEWYYPKVTVSVNIKDAKHPIGVFGYYEKLILVVDQPLNEIKHIWAQDLLADESIDIKDEVMKEGNTIVIPGALIEKIGTQEATEGDISAPGLVLMIDAL